MNAENDEAARKLRTLGRRIRLAVDQIHPDTTAATRREIREIVATQFSEVSDERQKTIERVKAKYFPKRKQTRSPKLKERE